MNNILIVFVILYLLGTVALGFWASGSPPRQWERTFQGHFDPI